MGIGTLKKRVYDFKEYVYRQILDKKGKFIYKQLRMSTDTIPITNDNRIYLKLVATNENNRNNGIAEKLLYYVCNMEGYKECLLEVLSKNINAHRLYKKLGFKNIKKVLIFFFYARTGKPYIYEKNKMRNAGQTGILFYEAEFKALSCSSMCFKNLFSRSLSFSHAFSNSSLSIKFICSLLCSSCSS